ncbi:MAG: 2-oxoglutarate and iron-dependent oxygenase domain-containing protein, partial [Halocynthiibacter sp.]
MGYAEAKQVESNVIPVVDITALRDGSDPMGVAKALHAANTGLGFIYIKGHGIPEDLIDAVRAGAFDFFRSDEASKEDV